MLFLWSDHSRQGGLGGGGGGGNGDGEDGKGASVVLLCWARVTFTVTTPLEAKLVKSFH